MHDGAGKQQVLRFAQDDKVYMDLGEGGEFDEVVVRDSFYGLSGFAPGAQAASDYEYFEAEFL